MALYDLLKSLADDFNNTNIFNEEDIYRYLYSKVGGNLMASALRGRYEEWFDIDDIYGACDESGKYYRINKYYLNKWKRVFKKWCRDNNLNCRFYDQDDIGFDIETLLLTETEYPGDICVSWCEKESSSKSLFQRIFKKD